MTFMTDQTPIQINPWDIALTAGIGIDPEALSHRIIQVLLRSENNLIIANEDEELYVDLQLESGIAPTDDFPVWVNVGVVNASDGWSQNGLLLRYQATSWAYAQWLYWADGKLYFDGGTGTFKLVYYASDVDTLLQQLRTYVDGELAKKVDKVNTPNQIYATSSTGAQTSIDDKTTAVYYIDGTEGNDSNDWWELTPYATWSAFTTAHGSETNIIVRICNIASTSIAITDVQGWTIERWGKGSNQLTAFTNSWSDHLILRGLNITTYAESWEAYYNLVEECTLWDMTLNMTGNNQTINEVRKCETWHVTLTSGKYLFTDTYWGTKWNNDERIITQNGGTLVLSGCGGYGIQRTSGTVTVKDGTELTRVSWLGDGTYCLISSDSAGYVYLLDGKSEDPIDLGGTASYTLGKFVFDKDNSSLAGTNLDEVLTAKQMVDTQTFESIVPDSTRQEDINKALDHQIWTIINGWYAPTGRDRGLVLNAYTGELCYQLTTVNVNNAGTGYAPWDVLFLDGVDPDEVWLLGRCIVDTVDTNWEILTVIIDQKWAYTADQSQIWVNTSTNWAGTWATLNITTTAGTGTTTASIWNPIIWDVCTVLRNEMTTNKGTWQFIYSDKNGDGNNEWTPSRPITTWELQWDNSTIKTDNGIISITQWVMDKINWAVQTTTNQTVNGTKTFTTSPVVPSKNTDAWNNPTTLATEAQVYKKIDKVTGGTLDNVASLTSDGQVADSGIAKANLELNTNKETWSTLTDSTTNYPSSHTVKEAIGGSVNTKTFYLSSTSDTTTAQEAYDWYVAGKNPIVVLSDIVYVLWDTPTSTGIKFYSHYKHDVWNSDTELSVDYIKFALSSWTVTSVTKYVWDQVKVLATNVTWYVTPYTPTSDWHPATKKYVDDHDTIVSASQPTGNHTEWELWYDTTNDVLKVYDGVSTWNPIGNFNPWAGTQWQILTHWAGDTYSWENPPTTGIANDTTGTTTTVAKIRAGTQAEYTALSTYDSTTIYYIF